MRTIYRSIAVGLFESKDHKFLFGRKDPNGGGVYPDCWHTPGGGIEDGESKLEALNREMLEEVGLDTKRYKVSLLDEEGTGESLKFVGPQQEKVLCKMKFFVYKIAIPEDASKVKVKLSDDLVGYAWVSLDELGGYMLTPPSMELFKRLGYLD